MPRRKEKTHRVVVTITFNVPVTRKEAAAAVGDVFWGEQYPTMPNQDATFRVRSARPQQRKET
jgi:hypothetical protein